jgi:hypothetical protein
MTSHVISNCRASHHGRALGPTRRGQAMANGGGAAGAGAGSVGGTLLTAVTARPRLESPERRMASTWVRACPAPKPTRSAASLCV